MAIPFLGEFLALVSALFYGFGSVAISRNAECGGGDNGAYLSILLTSVLAGCLWLVMGKTLPPAGPDLLWGILWCVLAGVLANLFGRVMMFRAVELVGAVEMGILRRLIPVFATLFAMIFLSEQITPAMAIGFVLVLTGVAIVISTNGPVQAVEVKDARDPKRGRLLGILSSASYGGSFIARKFSLQGLPDPLLGTFIGAVTGLFCGGGTALLSRRGRSNLRALFHRPAPWQFAAAASISAGQIALFFALYHTTVTAVAIIGSLEIFIAAWLSTVLLKTESKPTRGFVVASLLALAGTVAIAVG